MPILSWTVLCGAIVACLSSSATVEAAVQLARRGVEQYDGYRQRQSGVVMIAVLLVLIVFAAIFVLYWHRSRRDEDPEPRHAWQDLEKQKGQHEEPFQTVDLNEPAPVVHSNKKKLSEPAPVVSEPAPVVSEPAPVVSEPAPVVSEPAPVVHSTKKRATDTWDKYLSMIKSPSRLNSVVGKMSTMD